MTTIPLFAWIKRMMIQTLNIFGCCHEDILMKVSELSVAIAALSTQLSKVQGEILGKLTDLENALTDVDLPEEAIDALTVLRTNVQSLDDIVPDVTPE